MAARDTRRSKIRGMAMIRFLKAGWQSAGRFDVDALDECDSTSSELMRRAERGAPSGSVVVADRQSAGRGRRGRSWLSSPESSLTFSLLWRFPGNAASLSGLSLAVGVGLAQAMENLGAKALA
jgi:BirA family biotin operon repressor/biotin-[acetyl-CoA-carboxylase] ligase